MVVKNREQWNKYMRNYRRLKRLDPAYVKWLNKYKRDYEKTRRNTDPEYKQRIRDKNNKYNHENEDYRINKNKKRMKRYYENQKKDF